MRLFYFVLAKLTIEIIRYLNQFGKLKWLLAKLLQLNNVVVKSFLLLLYDRLKLGLRL